MGNYYVEATAHGFEKTLQSGIQLNVNQVARVDLQLKVGAAGEVTQVTGRLPLIATETSSLGTVETQQRIVDLPLNGRLFTQLAWLGPGASPGSSSGIGLSGSTDDNRPGIQLAVNGLWAFDNNFLLDGVDNNGIGDGTIAVNPSPDAIGEFRVEENSMKAEFGRGGAAVNAALKSGTNQIHGGAFEYLRNDDLDARNYFDTGQQWPESSTETQPVRRLYRWTDHQEQNLHLWGLARIAAARGGSRYIHRSHCRGAQLGILAIEMGRRCRSLRPIHYQRATGARQLLNPSNPSVIPSNRIDAIGQKLVNLFPYSQPARSNHCHLKQLYSVSGGDSVRRPI